MSGGQPPVPAKVDSFFCCSRILLERARAKPRRDFQRRGRGDYSGKKAERSYPSYGKPFRNSFLQLLLNCFIGFLAFAAFQSDRI